MNQEELTSLKNWFAGYCASFSMPVQEDQRHIDIKRDHTREVLDIIPITLTIAFDL